MRVRVCACVRVCVCVTMVCTCLRVCIRLPTVFVFLKPMTLCTTENALLQHCSKYKFNKKTRVSAVQHTASEAKLHGPLNLLWEL